MKSIIIVISLLLFPCYFLFGQGWNPNENNFGKNWNITFQVGRTALLSEINTDFKGSSNDMNNQSDWGFNFEVGKMIWDRFDVGFEFGISNYKGYKNYSSNVNWLMLYSQFNNEVVDFQPFPIYYDSDVTNFTVFAKYSFINFSTLTKGYLKMNLYLKLGIGVAFPSAELGYKDPENYEFTGLTHPLYLKGRYPNPIKDMHKFFNPALGLNYQLSDRVFLSAETSFQLVGADNLDGIHNYNNSLTPDLNYNDAQAYRIQVYDLTAKFMIGVTYFFNFDTNKVSRQKRSPWYSNQFQSYYSKFHSPTSKKVRQKRSPFFNNKSIKKR